MGLSGAVIVGGVTLGDNAAVSANSLVVRDVPAGGVVMGVPVVRLVSRRSGSCPGDERELADDDGHSKVRASALSPQVRPDERA